LSKKGVGWGKVSPTHHQLLLSSPEGNNGKMSKKKFKFEGHSVGGEGIGEAM
jgi:hypothetical protein